MMLIVTLAAALFMAIEAATLSAQLGIVSTLINSLSTVVVRVVSSLSPRSDLSECTSCNFPAACATSEVSCDATDVTAM